MKYLNMEPIFKAGDRVFDLEDGWGTIDSVDHPITSRGSTIGTLVRLTFDDDKVYCKGMDYHLALKRLSFKEYNLVTGGFSHERPKQMFKPGQVLYIRDGFGWHVGRFVNIEKGVISINTKCNKSDWDISPYTVLNKFNMLEVIAIQTENPFS